MHPILTLGGEVINLVPGEAVIEMMVRAKTIAAIKDANKKRTAHSRQVR